MSTYAQICEQHDLLNCFACREHKNPFKLDNDPKNMRVDMKSTDAQIKNVHEAHIVTGLKLSEAVKLLEENPGALIMPENDFGAPKKFLELKHHELKVRCKYSVKLPPPKSVSVTRADVFDAVESTDISMLPHKELAEKLCRKLGL